jgi:uncharacterized protein YjbI with pentapeptide repeats/uncharacterized protein (DUF697 family)
MVPDFSGQRCRGQSFRGQDLSGANFTRADLRGADFTRANLSGANFSYAQFGLPPLQRNLLLAAAAIAATLSGAFSASLGYLIADLQTRPLPSLPLLLGILSFLLLITHDRGINALNQWLMRFLVILVVLISMILGGHPDWGNALTMVALAIALTVGLTQFSAILIRCGELIASPVESAALIAISVAVASAVTIQPIAIGLALGAIALGYSQRQARPIHAIAAVLSSFGGTRLRQTNLTRASFAHASLRNTDLRQANITHTQFYQAKALDQARLGQSILHQPEVRQLVVTLDGRGRSFGEFDLSQANLQAADLNGANLVGANLNGADLSNANLVNANLLRVNAIATIFRQAKLTGACVADWNIDASTQLQDVDCRYVYLATANRQRQPAQDNWASGEFTRYFTIGEQDQGSIFDLELPATEAINPQEILASLMVLVRLAIADHNLEAAEQLMLVEALKALELPAEVTLERLTDDRTSFDQLLQKINSPIIRERVYQSAYLMARLDGELENEETELLSRIQTQLALSDSTIEKLQAAVSAAQEQSIAEQIAAINDPEQRIAAVKTNIRLMSLMHAFSGAMPIPGFAIVTHLMIYKDQVELVQKIRRIWGYSDDHKAAELNQALFGSVGATAARMAISNVMLLIPVWGSVVGASTAFSMTWAIGELAQKFFAGEADTSTLATEFAEAKALGQKVFQESQAAIAAKQQEIATMVQELQAGLRSGHLTQQDYLHQFKLITSQNLSHLPPNSSLSEPH